MLTVLLFFFILVLMYKPNYKSLKNILKETIVAQVVMCLIYILIFFIDSAIASTLGDAWGIIVLIIIAIIPIILTKYYMKSDKQETEKIKRFINTSIIWIIENAIICACASQIAPGWWPLLAYMILIGYIAIAPIVLTLICKVISFIYHKIKGLN